MTDPQANGSVDDVVNVANLIPSEKLITKMRVVGEIPVLTSFRNFPLWKCCIKNVLEINGIFDLFTHNVKKPANRDLVSRWVCDGRPRGCVVR